MEIWPFHTEEQQSVFRLLSQFTFTKTTEQKQTDKNKFIKNKLTLKQKWNKNSLKIYTKINHS